MHDFLLNSFGSSTKLVNALNDDGLPWNTKLQIAYEGLGIDYIEIRTSSLVDSVRAHLDADIWRGRAEWVLRWLIKSQRQKPSAQPPSRSLHEFGAETSQNRITEGFRPTAQSVDLLRCILLRLGVEESLSIISGEDIGHVVQGSFYDWGCSASPTKGEGGAPPIASESEESRTALIDSAIRLVGLLRHHLLTRDAPRTRIVSDSHPAHSKNRRRRWALVLGLSRFSKLLGGLLDAAHVLLSNSSPRIDLAMSISTLCLEVFEIGLSRPEWAPENVGGSIQLKSVSLAWCREFANYVLPPLVRLHRSIEQHQYLALENLSSTIQSILTYGLTDPAKLQFEAQGNRGSRPRQDRQSTATAVLPGWEFEESLRHLPDASTPFESAASLGLILSTAARSDDSLASIANGSREWLCNLAEKLLDAHFAQIGFAKLRSKQTPAPICSSDRCLRELQHASDSTSAARWIRVRTCQELSSVSDEDDIDRAIHYIAHVYYAEGQLLERSLLTRVQHAIAKLADYELLLRSALRLLQRQAAGIAVEQAFRTLERCSSEQTENEGLSYQLTKLHLQLVSLVSRSSTEQGQDFRLATHKLVDQLIVGLKSSATLSQVSQKLRTLDVSIQSRYHSTSNLMLANLIRGLTIVVSKERRIGRLKYNQSSVLYVQLCSLTLRAVLRYLYHSDGSLLTVVPLLIEEMKMLFELSRGFHASRSCRVQDQPRPIGATLSACATAYSKLLALVADPPAPRARKRRPSSSKGANRVDLSSSIDVVRRQSRRYLPPLVMHYIKQEHAHALGAEEKRALAPGMSSLFGCLKSQVSTVFGALRASERDLLGLVLAEWKKGRGKE